jgi:hypothetical protein
MANPKVGHLSPSLGIAFAKSFGRYRFAYITSIIQFLLYLIEDNLSSCVNVGN